MGAAPELDAIEMKLPANLCVLFRALAHAQVRRELGDDDLTSESDTTSPVESGSGGYFSGWFGSSKAASDASGDTTRAVAETEMSEDDWSNLQRVFDVEGHAEVAASYEDCCALCDAHGFSCAANVSRCCPGLNKLQHRCLSLYHFHDSIVTLVLKCSTFRNVFSR